MNPRKPHIRRSSADSVVTEVSDWITQGKLASNAHLPSEAELAEQLGVSRTVIREAVRLLAERGLILIVHGKRHIVAINSILKITTSSPTTPATDPRLFVPHHLSGRSP